MTNKLDITNDEDCGDSNRPVFEIDKRQLSGLKLHEPAWILELLSGHGLNDELAKQLMLKIRISISVQLSCRRWQGLV